MSESIMDDVDTTLTAPAKIKVIGVGGAGGNAVQEMIDADLCGVQFVCANTDLQALCKNKAPLKVQLGEKLTKGLGAGANPAVGKEAALESINAIKDAIGDADMVFVTAGMGGGTGTGAAPIVAQAAKEMNVLTVGVVTKPFLFEGVNKQRIAEEGLEELKKYVDSLIIIPNDRLINIAPKKAKLSFMLQMANEVLFNAVRGISDVIMRDGQINVDFADVRTTMQQTGIALMGTGRAAGENRAREAAQRAIMSPLLDDVSLESAKAILYNITTNGDITIDEVSEIGYMIHEATANDANVNFIFGIVYDEAMGDELQVTIIATGIEPNQGVEEGDFGNEKITQFNAGEPKQSRIEFKNAKLIRKQQPGSIMSEEPVPDTPYAPQSRYEARPPRDVYSLRSPVNRYMPGKDSATYCEEDLEIPTFIRTNAD